MQYIILMIALVVEVYGDDDCTDTYTKLTEMSPNALGEISQFRVNEWTDDNTQQIYTALTMGDGNIYDNFIVFYPWYTYTNNVEYSAESAYVIYDLNGEYNTFTAVIGMENNNVCVMNNNDGIKFQFYLDGILVYESEELMQHEFANVNINAQNANKLKIEVHRLDSIWCDHATIANPVLYSCDFPILPPESCEWELIYENNWGQVQFGNTLDLIDNLRNGHDLRIWGSDNNGGEWVWYEPDHIRINGDRVYVENKGYVYMNYDENGDAILDGSRFNNALYDTKGLIYAWADGSDDFTKTQYGHTKWFTKC